MCRTPGKATLGPELKPTKIPVRARISAVLFSPTILDAFDGFKKVWFFHCSPPHSFQSEKYRLTWDGKCEKFSVLIQLNSSPEGVLRISGDRGDGMGTKIKTQKSPWTKIIPQKNLMPNFRAITKIYRKHKMI